MRVSGAVALAAANTFGEMAQPNLLNELLQTLGWPIATSQDDTKVIEFDCGMIFYSDQPFGWQFESFAGYAIDREKPVVPRRSVLHGRPRCASYNRS